MLIKFSFAAHSQRHAVGQAYSRPGPHPAVPHGRPARRPRRQGHPRASAGDGPDMPRPRPWTGGDHQPLTYVPLCWVHGRDCGKVINQTAMACCLVGTVCKDGEPISPDARPVRCLLYRKPLCSDVIRVSRAGSTGRHRRRVIRGPFSHSLRRWIRAASKLPAHIRRGRTEADLGRTRVSCSRPAQRQVWASRSSSTVASPVPTRPSTPPSPAQSRHPPLRSRYFSGTFSPIRGTSQGPSAALTRQTPARSDRASDAGRRPCPRKSRR